jgi:hypothetical protein
MNAPVQTRLKTPYVGPRPFQKGDKLYGRDREILELSNRLLANHVVLMHALSGAGKSSLINAGLVPSMEGQEFRVLKVVRVNRQPEVRPLAQEAGALAPDSAAQNAPGPGPAQAGAPDSEAAAPGGTAPKPPNRYALSTLISLEEDRPAKKRMPPEELAGLSLLDYLERRQPKRKDAPRKRMLLIFDQFEEVLTLDPAAIEEKKAFFGWLMPVLYDVRYWALFSIRDDYVGGLEPYLGYFPDRLTSRYRLEFLSKDAALDAIRLPAEDAGVYFDKDAAGWLVDELRKITSTDLEGNRIDKPGPFIEPIQLQVVCLRLWKSRRPDPEKITQDDVTKFGNVDTALGDYFDDVLEEIAGDDLRRQRTIRDWFGHQLLTEEGLRSQTPQPYLPRFGLDLQTVGRLIDAYLVRSDQRPDATWYELAHDRLVRPVQVANARWRDQNLQDWQLTAERWDRLGRPANSDLLLKGEALRALQASLDPSQASPVDVAFLEASQKAVEEARLVEIRRWADPERLRRVELGTNLDETGWGVIFHQDANPELREALKELLDHRKAQAGQYREIFYREFSGLNGYRPGDTAQDFLGRNGAGAGLANPEKVPYYLLIVGGPQLIPFEFQYGLDQDYAVGRIDFAALEEYQSYARSVVVCEGGTFRLPNRLAFFGPKHSRDAPTEIAVEKLVRPLSQALATGQTNWYLELVAGAEASKATLDELLGGRRTPALLMVTGHSLNAPAGREGQPEDTGAIVCSDWPGPNEWRGSLSPEHYFGYRDVDDQARLLGLVALLSLSHSAGAPARSDFEFGEEKATARAQTPFLARLPQRLLGHPRGGALAVIAHVDRLYMYSFTDEHGAGEIGLYQDLLGRLMQGYTVGAAVELLNLRYAQVNARLQERLQGAYFYGQKADETQLRNMMVRALDARNYVVIGDPAARLPVDPAQPYRDPGPDWVRPEIPAVVPLASTTAPPAVDAVAPPAGEVAAEESTSLSGELWQASGVDAATGGYASTPLTAAQVVALLRSETLRASLSQDLRSRRVAKY